MTISMTNYLNTSEWKVVNEMTIHAFNEDETPIDVVCVEIGTYMGDDGVAVLPILRWITKKQYVNWTENNDVVIW